MDRAGFKRARELFDGALERSGDERHAFVKDACGSDQGLLEQVERLLRFAEREEDHIRTGEKAAAPLTSASPDREPALTTPHGVSVGMLAPAFDLPCVSVDSSAPRRVSLSSFRGRWLVLVFYPRDFSLVCPTELTALSNRMEEFGRCGADILGVSVDSIESHERWLTTPTAHRGLGGLRFPLASDEDGAVSRAYGVYLEPQHVSLRGLFLIDPNGVLQYQAVHNLNVGRRSDDILRVLSALQTGGLCAEDWTPGMATVDPTCVLCPGNMVSHYRIEECVGTGAFGSVFRAQDMTLKRTVALKVLNPDNPSSIGAVLAEARAAAALNHTNICTIFAVDDSEGIPFIAMEYVRGQLLSELIDAGPVPVQKTANIGRQVAMGMAAAHAMGISHGDLKPANVIVRDDGVVKILDFGLARLGEGSLDTRASATIKVGKTGRLRGTPAYMSPEQAAGGRATRKSDVFALGVMLYELATGEGAFLGETIPQILSQIQTVDPNTLAAAVPEPFATVVSRALVCDAHDRDITMQEITDALA